jgi:hypothetical protein
VLRLIPVLVLVAGIGLGGYLFYQLFIGAPSAKKGQFPNSVAQASAPPMVLASATPNQEALVSPSAKSSAVAPNRAALAGPPARRQTERRWQAPVSWPVPHLAERHQQCSALRPAPRQARRRWQARAQKPARRQTESH